MPSGPASNRWGHVGVRAFGTYWQLLDVPASEWITAATTPDMAGVFPGLVDDAGVAELFDLLLREPDMRQRCVNVSRKALERAGNREWHWTLNLIKEIQGSWTHINGLLVRDGVRASRTSLDDYLDAAYTVFLEKLGEKESKAFETRLRKIPGGFSSKPRMSGASDLKAFARE